MQQCCYSSEGPWVWDQATVMFYDSHAYNGTYMLLNRLRRKGSGGGRGRSLRNDNAANHVPDGCDSLPDYAAGAFVIRFISPSITISHWKAVLPLDSTKELRTLNLFMKWGMCRWKDSLLSYFSKQKTLILSHVRIWVIHKYCHSILNLIIYYTALFEGVWNSVYRQIKGLRLGVSEKKIALKGIFWPKHKQYQVAAETLLYNEKL